MEPIRSSTITSIAAGLATELIKALYGELKHTWEAPEDQKCLQGCLDYALCALTLKLTNEFPENEKTIEEALKHFFKTPAVAERCINLLSGEEFSEADVSRLQDRFRTMAEVQNTPLKELDLREHLSYFRKAFLSAAQAMPALKDRIQSGNALQQTEELQNIRKLIEKWFSKLDEQTRLQYAPFLNEAGIVCGDISTNGGDVVTGTKITNKVTHHNYYGSNQQENSASNELPDWEKEYLNNLYSFCMAIPLQALGRDESVLLDKVYIELNTTAKEKEDDDKLLPAKDALLTHQHMVLLGDPGSGKSTFAKKALGLIAGSLLHKNVVENPFDGLTPVWLSLRQLVPHLLEATASSCDDFAEQNKILEVVEDYLLNLSDIKCDHKGFLKKVKEGGCFIVFDGLDEVPTEQRLMIRKAVSTVVERWKPQRILVTCRIRSYVGETVFRDIPTVFTLSDLNEEQISGYCKAWYLALSEKGRLSEKDALEKAGNLSRNALSERLKDLSRTPILLATMALVHFEDTELPDQKVLLYERAVDVLSRQWERHEKKSKIKTSLILEGFLKSKQRMHQALRALAYAAHKTKRGRAENKSGDLERFEAIYALEKEPDLFQDLNSIEDFLNYIDQRSGVVLGLGGETGKTQYYSFPHRTFQEYLAGCHMVAMDPYTKFCEKAEDGDYWYEAVKFAVEHILFSQEAYAIYFPLAFQLCQSDKPETEKDWRLNLWGGYMTAACGEQRLKQYAEDQGRQKGFKKRVQPRMVEIMSESPLPAVERAEAGRLLAKIGDPRPEVMTVEGMEFCKIEPNWFWMGERDKLHEVEIKKPYWMGKYPVTNAQFNQFVKAGGYENPKYWTEAKTAGYWSKNGFKGSTDSKPRKQQGNFGEPFNFDNHPVVGFSWYEALAFCLWLTDVYKESTSSSAEYLQWIREGNYSIQLPNEPEWEMAARGSKEASLNQTYPYGEEAEPNQMNCYATNIGATSTVGCFPSGESSYGCLDMAGNVFEWTRSLYQDYPYIFDLERENLAADKSNARVLRGGAFNYCPSDYCRCACRFRFNPDFHDWCYGFRVCVSPF